MLSSLLVLVLAVVAPSVHATVFVTSPTASTSWPAGQQATVTWQDDGNTPTLKSFGPSSIGLYAGSQQQQTLLQMIGTNVDVSAVSSATWQPDPTVGPNYGAYFIRFTSNSLPDPTQSGAFVEAFSAKFALTGMTGTFNATVAGEISGTLGASSTAASSTPVPSGSSTVAASKLSTSTVKSSSSPSGTSSSSSKSSNGAGHIVVPSVVGASGVAAVVFAFFL